MPARNLRNLLWYTACQNWLALSIFARMGRSRNEILAIHRSRKLDTEGGSRAEHVRRGSVRGRARPTTGGTPHRTAHARNSTGDPGCTRVHCRRSSSSGPRRRGRLTLHKERVSLRIALRSYIALYRAVCSCADRTVIALFNQITGSLVNGPHTNNLSRITAMPFAKAS